MKRLFFTLFAVCIFVACSGDIPMNVHSENVQILDVQKVIINGLPAVSPTSGKAVELEIGYYDAGKSPSSSTQLFKRYTQSGEYPLPNGIDIYYITEHGAVKNPPEFTWGTAFENNTLTITLAEVDYTIDYFEVEHLELYDVRKIIINGLPVFTSTGEALQAGIGHHIGDILDVHAMTVPTRVDVFYTEPGEYLFPGGLTISCLMTKPNRDPLWNFVPEAVFDRQNKTLTINIEKRLRGLKFHDVRKIIITGLPSVTSTAAGEIVIDYFDTGKQPQPPLSPDDLLKLYYTEAGEHLFPEGIDIQVMEHTWDEMHNLDLQCSFENNILTINVVELPRRPVGE